MSHDSKTQNPQSPTSSVPKLEGRESNVTPTALPNTTEGKGAALTPAQRAMRRVEAAASTVETGPELIEAALDELREQVRAYGDAHDLLSTLDALPDAAPAPHRLPGAKAVEALGKRRGRPKKSAAPKAA
ncbi:hypothetical protein PQI66_14435 [Corynebacterium sp. USCH3]|uniref:hypothetical protein n=1 Tax=Corynebacterium sp. USCH3 TaxID=3024840 RepID=UPI003097FF5B